MQDEGDQGLTSLLLGRFDDEEFVETRIYEEAKPLRAEKVLLKIGRRELCRHGAVKAIRVSADAQILLSVVLSKKSLHRTLFEQALASLAKNEICGKN